MAKVRCIFNFGSKILTEGKTYTVQREFVKNGKPCYKIITDNARLTTVSPDRFESVNI